jgi:hypothetical protein
MIIRVIREIRGFSWLFRISSSSPLIVAGGTVSRDNENNKAPGTRGPGAELGWALAARSFRCTH